MSDIMEKIATIELEMSRTQKNKATEGHLGILKSKLAKLRTELLAPMPAPHFMRILESIPAMEYGIAWRKFQRCRHLVEGLCSKPASAGFKVALYVRGEQPPPVAFEVRPPRLMLLTLRGGELYFVVHLGPRGKGAHMLQPALDLSLIHI